MTARRVPEPALFSVFERLIFAVAALAIFPFIVQSMVGFPLEWVPEEQDSLVTRAIRFITATFPSADELGGWICVLTTVAVAVVTFRKSRREPRFVAVGFSCLVGAYLIATGIYLPHRLAFFLEYATQRLSDPIGLGNPWIVDIFFAPYAFGLLWICLAGEFSALVHRRELRDELRAAVDTSEEETRQVRRRQRLIGAALGPRMPVAQVVGPVLLQIVIPPLAFITLAMLMDSPDMELRIQAPSFAKAESPTATSWSELRIAGNGQVMQEEQVIADASDHRLRGVVTVLAQKPRSTTRPTVVLRVDANVEHQRLIEVIQAVERAKVRPLLEE